MFCSYQANAVRVPVTRVELATDGQAERLPLSAKEARAQCNIPHNDDDALLLGYIRSATAEAERAMNRVLIAKNYRLFLDRFYTRIDIPLAKLLSVDQVFYWDKEGQETELPASFYEVGFNGDYPGFIQLGVDKVWPELDPARRLDRVRVDFHAGYGDNLHDVPADVLAGLRERIGTMYQIREDVVIGSSVAEVPGNAGRAYARHEVVEFC